MVINFRRFSIIFSSCLCALRPIDGNYDLRDFPFHLAWLHNHELRLSAADVDLVPGTTTPSSCGLILWLHRSVNLLIWANTRTRLWNASSFWGVGTKMTSVLSSLKLSVCLSGSTTSGGIVRIWSFTFSELVQWLLGPKELDSLAS